MSNLRKNVLVGATVIVALALLGWMILQFSDVPIRWFKGSQLPVVFEASNAEGLSEGSPVQYLGVTVGRITRISRSQDLRTVYMDAQVDPPLPANVEGRIRSQIIGGGGSLDLVLVPARPTTSPSQPASRPSRIEPQGSLEANTHIRTVFVGLENLLPAEFSELSQEIRRTSEQFRQSDLVPKLATAVDAFRGNMDKTARLIDSMQSLVGDETMRREMREIVTNLKTTSESATRISANMETLSKNANIRLDELAGNGNKVLTSAQGQIDGLSSKLTGRLAQMAGILEHLESVTAKLDKGEGSAGKLLNDPALYENLVDFSKELKSTAADVRRLMEQWETEGLYFKLNKGK